MKVVLGMVLIEGSKKEIEQMLQHPEIAELLSLQKEALDSKTTATPTATYYTMSNTGNV